jgi:hypothetical protein
VILRRPRHRVRQFITALRPRVDLHDRAEAYAYLNDAQRHIFETMMLRDQQHGIDVFRRVRAKSGDDRDLLAAALLHDCGKGHVRLWQRVAHVLLGTVTPGLRSRLAIQRGASWRQALWRLQHHPALGAAMVATTTATDGQTNGAHPEADVVRLIREQEASSPDERLAILQGADEV